MVILMVYVCVGDKIYIYGVSKICIIKVNGSGVLVSLIVMMVDGIVVVCLVMYYFMNY